jgi:hypothetical protein
VKRLRWVAYGEALRPLATVDIDARRRELDDAKFDAGDPTKEQRAARTRTRIAESQLALSELVKTQADVRASLWPEDEEPAEE